jgi:hypothetical protein
LVPEEGGGLGLGRDRDRGRVLVFGKAEREVREG